MESRREHPFQSKSAPLPKDYLKLVKEVFSTNFDAALKELKKQKVKAHFEASGGVFSDEVVLSLSLNIEGQLAATTFYASVDFDPKASAPTIQDLLAACVDGLGSVLEPLLGTEAIKDREKLLNVISPSLNDLEDVPFQWTALNVDKYLVFLKIDKANPHLDDLADEWLAKNDPEAKERAAKEHEETESLFVTGPKRTHH